MKRTIINLGLVLVAFAVGVSINNACSKSLEDMSDSDLRELVEELQNQVNDLKEKVAKMEGVTGGGFNGGFYVGKVPFYPSGKPAVDYASDVVSETIRYNKLTGKNDYHYIAKSQIQKDAQGRYLGGSTSYEVIEDNIGLEFITDVLRVEYSYTNNTCEVVQKNEAATNSTLTDKTTYYF